MLVRLAGLNLGNLEFEVAIGQKQVELAVEVVIEEEETELQRRLSDFPGEGAVQLRLALRQMVC